MGRLNLFEQGEYGNSFDKMADAIPKADPNIYDDATSAEDPESSHYDSLDMEAKRKSKAGFKKAIDKPTFSTYILPCSEYEETETIVKPQRKNAPATPTKPQRAEPIACTCNKRANKWTLPVISGVFGLILGCLICSVIFLTMDALKERKVVCEIIILQKEISSDLSATTSRINSTHQVSIMGPIETDNPTSSFDPTSLRIPTPGSTSTDEPISASSATDEPHSTQIPLSTPTTGAPSTNGPISTRTATDGQLTHHGPSSTPTNGPSSTNGLISTRTTTDGQLTKHGPSSTPTNGPSSTNEPISTRTSTDGPQSTTGPSSTSTHRLISSQNDVVSLTEPISTNGLISTNVQMSSGGSISPNDLYVSSMDGQTSTFGPAKITGGPTSANRVTATTLNSTLPTS